MSGVVLGLVLFALALGAAGVLIAVNVAGMPPERRRPQRRRRMLALLGVPALALAAAFVFAALR